MAGLLDFLSGGGSANDPATLARLRREQLDELRHNAGNARYGNNYVMGANPSDIKDLEGDIDEDPYTGLAAQADQRKRETELANEATFMSPGATDVRNTNQRDALARALAVPAQQGANALALEQEKQRGEMASQQGQQNFTRELMGGGAASGMGGGALTPSVNAAGGVSLRGTAPKPLGQLEQRAITSFKEAQPILDALDTQLGQPSNDPLSQLLSKASNSGQQFLYNHGLGTPDQSKLQLAGLLRVLGSSPYVVGSRHYQMIQQAMAHLTEGTASDAFNKTQLNEIRRLWPMMQDEIMLAHTNPGAPLNQGVAPDAYSDPNYRPR